jgi:hypothetical protein
MEIGGIKSNRPVGKWDVMEISWGISREKMGIGVGLVVFTVVSMAISCGTKKTYAVLVFSSQQKCQTEIQTSELVVYTIKLLVSTSSI